MWVKCRCLLGYIFRKNKYVLEIIVLTKETRFWITNLGSLALFIAANFILGAMYVVIVSQFVELDFSGAILIIGVNTASTLIGLITPGAPGGIGVREAAMLLLLAPFFPSDAILIAAVIQRVILITGDVITFPFSLPLKS